MARLRLFANLRELAGTSSVELDGATVDDVLQAATDKFGSDFGRALAPAQVWVDGDRAEPGTAVVAGSEVAVIPPVSGGALVVQSPAAVEFVLVFGLVAALFVGNHLSLQWFAVATVGVGGIWGFDVMSAADRRGLPVAYAPVLLGVLGGVIATYRFGIAGAAGAVGMAVLVSLLWSIMQPGLRAVDSYATGVLVAVTATAGAGAMIILRLRGREETLVFLFLVGIAVLASWLSDRSDVPLLDPLIALIVASVLAGALASAFWAPDLLAAIAGSVAAAIALVGGRNLGMLVRAGGFFSQGPVPGSLSYLDGLFLAAGAFWALLTILT